MIKKHTRLIPSDKCGVWEVKAIHLYKGFFRNTSYTGDFTKSTIRKVKPAFWKDKGTKVKNIIIRVKKETVKADGSYFFFKYNSCILLKKRLTPRGKELIGPTSFLVKRKKFLSSFAGII